MNQDEINVWTNEIKDAYMIRWIVGLVVMALEDIPQLTLCSKYLNGMNANDGFQLSDDPLTGVSLIMSSLSLVYNVFSIVENVGQSQGVSLAEKAKEAGKRLSSNLSEIFDGVGSESSSANSDANA